MHIMNVETFDHSFSEELLSIVQWYSRVLCDQLAINKTTSDAKEILLRQSTILYLIIILSINYWTILAIDLYKYLYTYKKPDPEPTKFLGRETHQPPLPVQIRP